MIRTFENKEGKNIIAKTGIRRATKAVPFLSGVSLRSRDDWMYEGVISFRRLRESRFEDVSLEVLSWEKRELARLTLEITAGAVWQI